MENNNPNVPRPMNDEGSVGPVIATIIILAVIVLGGLYFWHERQASEDVMDLSASSTAASIESQSSSDATDAINADLKSTDTTTVDGQMNAS